MPQSNQNMSLKAGDPDCCIMGNLNFKLIPLSAINYPDERVNGDWFKFEINYWQGHLAHYYHKSTHTHTINLILMHCIYMRLLGDLELNSTSVLMTFCWHFMGVFFSAAAGSWLRNYTDLGISFTRASDQIASICRPLPLSSVYLLQIRFSNQSRVYILDPERTRALRYVFVCTCSGQ